MLATTNERQEFIDVCREDGISEEDALSFLRWAATVQRLDITACNRELTKREQRKMDSHSQKLEDLAVENGISIRWGDPRGFTVGLRLKSKRYNSWGGEEAGWGIPTPRYMDCNGQRVGRWTVS